MNDTKNSVASANQLEFLTFTLGKEEYGVDIRHVQELRSYEAVTFIANSPPYIKGVVNLRGVIVPIIDMRLKLDLGASEYDQFTVVIILSMRGRTIGMVVDSVSDVIQLTNEHVKETPQMGGQMDTDYIMGIGSLDERMLILVDMEKFMSSDEIGLIDKLHDETIAN